MHHCDNVKPKKNWKSTWPKYIIYVSPDTNIGGINLNFEKKNAQNLEQIPITTIVIEFLRKSCSILFHCSMQTSIS